MENARIPTSEQLMAEMAWVRQLARALVRDAAVADDVAQDAWIVANEKQPDEDRPLRPWLGRVVRNLIRTRRRAEARRSDRDETYEEGRTVATPEQLVERVELQRAVADEVLALAEPYRSTVLLHFVEGMRSADIARQQGIPDGTVRRRLKVALDQLREALEKRANPPKRGWLAALVPLARLPFAPAPVVATAGGIAVKKIIGLVVLVVLAIGGVALWRMRAKTEQRAAQGESPPNGTIGSAQRVKTPTELPAWLAQPGAPLRRVAGVVVADGTPVAGARVALAFDVMGDGGEPMSLPSATSKSLQPLAETTSGADGTFDFGPRPAVALSVSASAVDHAPVVAAIENANPKSPSDHIVLRLGDCSSRLSGSVVDASGGGIAHARIAIAGTSGTDTDASGVYSVCIAPKDAFGNPSATVRVSADGYGSLYETVLAVGELHRDFALVPEAIATGHVTTPDGQPVASAYVVALPDAYEHFHHVPSAWAISDGDGRFRITGLAPGAYSLHARADGTTDDYGVPVFIRSTATSHDLHLVVTTVARIRGRVVLGDQPVAGVTVMGQLGRGMTAPVISQQDGSFEIVGVPAGTVRFSTSPYVVESPAEIEVTELAVHDVVIKVNAGPSVHGTVTRDGTPASGVNIFYMPTSSMRSIQRATTTDANGQYVLDGILPGKGHIYAMDAKNKAWSPGADIDVAATENKTLDLVLDRSGRVKGTIVDEQGAAVAGAYVRFDLIDVADIVDNCESITDASGHFDCVMLTGGTYRPAVMPTAGARIPFAPVSEYATIDVPHNGVVTGITIAVKNQRYAVRGVVVDDMGAPISDARIEASAPGIEQTMDVPSTMSDAQGRFTLANLAAGSYDLHAHASDGGDTFVHGVTAGTDGVVITLSRGGALVVTLAGFVPAAGMNVFHLTSDNHILTIALRKEGATFSREGLSPDKYLLFARGGDQVDGQTVEVQPGQTAHVTLTPRALSTVTGTLATAAHVPQIGMRCDARLLLDGGLDPVPPSDSFQSVTDANGHFSVRAPVGRIQLFCYNPQGGPPLVERDLDVTTAPMTVSLTATP